MMSKLAAKLFQDIVSVTMSGMTRPIVSKLCVGLFRDQDLVEVHIEHVMGVVYLHVRTCRRPTCPYIGNGWSEISYVIRDPLARRFTEVDDGISTAGHAHPFSVSRERLDELR